MALLGDIRNEDFVSGNVAETIAHSMVNKWIINYVVILASWRHNGASRSTQLIVANILRSSEGYVA